MRRKCSICGKVVEGFGEAYIHMAEHPGKKVVMKGIKK